MSLSSFLHTVKCFQVLLYNSHNLTSVICLHTVCFIRPLDRTLSGATTQCRSGNLLSFLLRCGTRPYERGTQWDSMQEWTLEQWQWRSTPHSPNHQVWSLTIGEFNVISRSLIGQVDLTNLQRCSLHIPQPSQHGLWRSEEESKPSGQ